MGALIWLVAPALAGGFEVAQQGAVERGTVSLFVVAEVRPPAGAVLHGISPILGRPRLSRPGARPHPGGPGQPPPPRSTMVSSVSGWNESAIARQASSMTPVRQNNWYT